MGQCCQSRVQENVQEINIDNVHYAVAIMNQMENSGVVGVIKLIQQGQSTRIQGKIKGLSKGLHGLHIHQYGNIVGQGLTGNHFNPFRRVHGGPKSPPELRHIGDLGNIESKGEKFETLFDFTDSQVKLTEDYSIIGRSFVINADQDDLGAGTSQYSSTTGNSGKLISIGVIGTSDKFEM